MPSVNALYRDFKAQGLEVLLIAFRESAAEVGRLFEPFHRAHTAGTRDVVGEGEGATFMFVLPLTPPL